MKLFERSAGVVAVLFGLLGLAATSMARGMQTSTPVLDSAAWTGPVRAVADWILFVAFIAAGLSLILRRVALANALGNLDDLDGESHQLRQVLAVNPGHVHARLSIGQNLRQRGKEDEAVPEFMMALQLPNEGPGRLADEV